MMEEAKVQGIRLGEDISIITFDDVGPLSLFDPPVTAIRQSVDEIGRIGFELLLKRMEGDMTAPRIRLPVTLMARGSVKRLR
jgi:LacI family transcriptional regulator